VGSVPLIRLALLAVVVAACSGEGEDEDRPIIKREVTLEIPRERERPPGACPELRVRVTSTSVTMIRGLAPTVVPTGNRPRLDAAFAGLAADCTGDVLLEADPDVGYAAVVEVISAAKDQGFAHVQLGTRTP
jgi:biopolymer transport protein ExbD